MLKRFFQWVHKRKRAKINKQLDQLAQYFHTDDWSNFCQLRDKLIKVDMLGVQVVIFQCIEDQRQKEFRERFKIN